MMEKKAINEVEPVKPRRKLTRVQQSPAMMIQMAVQGGADLEKLQGLLDLQMKYEANEAKKAYVRAMTAFKLNPPKINKDKKVKIPHKNDNFFTEYSHASLANVVEKINSALSAQGLSVSWTTKQNGAVQVTCKITHELGHGEETTLSAPADATGSKNTIQAIGSTITYLQRYTLLALTGLATEDMDNDAQSEVEYITEKEQMVICDILDNLKNSEQRTGLFYKHMGVDSVEKIKKADLNKAMKVLEATQKADKVKK